jgi:hypothetical protein
MCRRLFIDKRLQLDCRLQRTRKIHEFFRCLKRKLSVNSRLGRALGFHAAYKYSHTHRCPSGYGLLLRINDRTLDFRQRPSIPA